MAIAAVALPNAGVPQTTTSVSYTHLIITQDLFIYDIFGEDANGNLVGQHRSTGIGRPKFWDRARYYGEEERLAAALDAARPADLTRS